MTTSCGLFISNVNVYKTTTTSAKLNARKISSYVVGILQLCFYKKIWHLFMHLLAYVIGGL
jgi:hypothetical protein